MASSLLVMPHQMRLVLSWGLTLILAGCIAGGAGDWEKSPGYLETGKAVYDAKKYVKLYPGSLFDADNTPSVFRLGMVWDERYGDGLHLIVTFPLGAEVSMTDLQRSAGTFKMQIDGENVSPQRAKNPILLKQQRSPVAGEYEAEIRYLGSRQLIGKMLAAGNVDFYMQVVGKEYKTSLRVKAKDRAFYHDREYSAINGMQRFYNAIRDDGK